MRLNLDCEVKGATRLANKIQHRMNRIERTKEHIFARPLARTLTNIKRQLARDSKTGFVHNYKGTLTANTQYRFYDTGMWKCQIAFGYFARHGATFELGGRPRFVSLAILLPWAIHRFNDPFVATRIQLKILQRGTRSYPIIQRVWAGNQKNYLKIVHGRFWAAWK